VRGIGGKKRKKGGEVGRKKSVNEVGGIGRKKRKKGGGKGRMRGGEEEKCK
jgi:hypothetical protein